MASVKFNKGNGRFKLMVTPQELNTLTIAVALLSIPDMESEAIEQGLQLDQLEYDHNTLFELLTKVTKLYPVLEPEVEVV